MSYILSAQRKPETIASVFAQYRAYLAASAAHFPRGAHALATADWYFDPRDHRCPHDAWLESLALVEPAAGERSEHRVTTIRVRLRGAYHDGFIELFYPQVFSYSLNSPACAHGLGDWLYDEFRVTPDGHLLHEIEWAGAPGETGSRWIIEAADIEHQWTPNEMARSHIRPSTGDGQ